MSNHYNSKTDMLWSERDHINRSNELADLLIGQAADTQSNLDDQSEMLSGVRTKQDKYNVFMTDSTSLTNKISWKKCKNNIILALVTALCLFFIIWYKFL